MDLQSTTCVEDCKILNEPYICFWHAVITLVVILKFLKLPWPMKQQNKAFKAWPPVVWPEVVDTAESNWSFKEGEIYCLQHHAMLASISLLQYSKKVGGFRDKMPCYTGSSERRT